MGFVTVASLLRAQDCLTNFSTSAAPVSCQHLVQHAPVHTLVTHTQQLTVCNRSCRPGIYTARRTSTHELVTDMQQVMICAVSCRPGTQRQPSQGGSG